MITEQIQKIKLYLILTNIFICFIGSRIMYEISQDNFFKIIFIATGVFGIIFSIAILKVDTK